MIMPAPFFPGKQNYKTAGKSKLSRQQFIKALKDLGKVRYHSLHPFHKLLHNGKLSFEQILQAYQKNFNNKIIITRFSNFYGRGQLEHRLIPKIMECINKGLKFPLHGNGLTKRDFIFDEDFNDAFLKVLKKGKLGKTYHFSTNYYVTVKKIIEIICNFKNVNYKDIIFNVPERKGKDKYYFLDCNQTSKELNWKPKNTLEQGLTKTINYIDKAL